MYQVLIWGTGDISRKIEEEGINAQIVGYIETNKQKESHRGKKVYGVNEIPHEYDYIIVANMYGKEIYQTCMEAGINRDKIIFLQNVVPYSFGDVPVETIINILGEKTTIQYLSSMIEADNTFFAKDLETYKLMNKRDTFMISEDYIYPIITDKYDQAGAINSYLLQDLWAAKLIYGSGVKKHYDIGSRIDGFITHLLAMDIMVTLIDIRECPGELDGLDFIQDDATLLSSIPDESIESLSALCSLEHFGLGRYGDEIDPEACFKCFAAIQRKLKQGGTLYLSVPVGKERVEFNAHRIFYASTIVHAFSEMELKEFSCGFGNKIERNVQDIHKYDSFVQKGRIRFGLFHFIKK